VAIRDKVTIPFTPVIDKVMPEVAGWLQARGVERLGPAVFKYNVIDMPRLEVEMGFAPAAPPKGEGRVLAGVLPAGRYATLTHWGHYDRLMDATAVLIGWAKETGIAWDSSAAADGEHFVSRFELYPNGPMDTPDPEKWETQIFIKVRG
jgi:effector-binding domain-containing protein